ncbi:flagellar motor switch protein FliM [Jatrophihabitans endophyticus]|uniref:Flagellar motor switch protein FliM n=1 Tax=Jatrophihabitans endophyticus TaxID=1206085 RepID=A0A1M5IGI2_9ACTN|nr:flagellar motor switch protein FliM [Jatrophihabitans endophyticus]
MIELPNRQPNDPTDGARPESGARTDDNGVVAYDFRRPVKVSREHVRVLQMAFDTMARRLTTLLTSGLREVCQVQIDEVTQQSYDDYAAALASPSVTVPLGLAPLGGTGTVHFSLPVSLAAIDHMLGGPGGAQPTRTLTDIELPLLQGLLEQIVGVLRYALEPIVALECTIGSVEYNPQFLQAAGPADAVIVGVFTLQIGAVTSPLLVSLPMAPMLPLLDAQGPTETVIDPAAQAGIAARLSERVNDVALDVSIEFAPVPLTADRILTMAVGDVVTLPQRVGTPLTVYAGGVDYARAVAGRAGSRLAALVVEVPGAAGTAQQKESLR